MKTVFLLSSLLLFHSLNAQEAILKDVPAHVFVNHGKTNFDSVFVNVDLEPIVKDIFHQGILFHDYTLEVHPSSNFQTYWSVFKVRWFAVDMKNDGDLVYIMLGKTSSLDEKEYVEIYTRGSDQKYHRSFAEAGKLLAYKIHPNTQEVMLYHHRYPCCYSASHNIYTIRFLNGQIHLKDRFFVGRDTGDMVGPFFPEKVVYPIENKLLDTETILYWSPEVVKTKAFQNYSETNRIATYSRGSVYKELYKQGAWSFVVLFSGISSEPSAVINPTNFENRAVYGWMMLE